MFEKIAFRIRVNKLAKCAKEYAEKYKYYDNRICYCIPVSPSKVKDKPAINESDCLNDDLSKVKQHLTENKEKTFQEELNVFIQNSGMKDTDVYKNALMDRRLFSKIMMDVNYKPSKDTVLALAIALKLDIEKTNKLLNSAGYSLSRSLERDMVIEYFIQSKQYALLEINGVLNKLGYKTLGG